MNNVYLEGLLEAYILYFLNTECCHWTDHVELLGYTVVSKYPCTYVHCLLQDDCHDIVLGCT
jgi:hypothetical protein